jgi:transcriptional regulator with XRE-family HTH domain
MIFLKNLGKNLKYYRKIRGYTQEKLADKVGVSTEFIRSIENKNSPPRLENFIKICDILNIPSDFLLKGDCKISDIQTIDLLMQEFDGYSDDERRFYIETLQNIINHKNNININDC